MGKNTFLTGQPIFTQLLKFIPPTLISKLISKHQSDRYYKKFRTREHLVTMLYTCFHGCKSIREVITGMQVSFSKLNHLGMNCIPRRSTLSDANKIRSENLFGQLFHALYTYYYESLPDSRRIKPIDKRLFIIDSTTVNLFSDVMKGMGMKPQNGKRKGGAKAHILIKADEDVPRFVDLTHASKNDRIILEKVTFEKGSIVVFDKGYVNYAKWAQWTKDEVTWVTRIGDTASYHVKDSNPISDHQRNKGVVTDENIIMGRASNKNTTKLAVRKITYKHADRTFEFITNNWKLSSLTIANIYKQRWQIELLFRRIKQSYPLKYFLGDSENAIKIQIWCALITDLLVKIVKDKIKKKRWSYANLSSMIRLHLMSYIDLFKFLNNPDKALTDYHDNAPEMQLKLYT